MTEPTFADRDAVARTDAHGVALDCLAAGIAAALPERIVADRVSVDGGILDIEPVDGTRIEYDLDDYDEIRLIGAGKAAGGMANALATRLGDRLAGGAVVTTNDSGGHASGTNGGSDAGTNERSDDDDDEVGFPPGSPVDVLPGDHPLPSDRGVASTRRIVDIADGAGSNDLVIAVVTGGGSALLAAPADPISVDEFRTAAAELLASGASIDEINAVRKHCSAVKGGRLARVAAPAAVLTLAVSDVVGDDLGVIASGPTAPDPSTYADALAVCDRYDLDLPAAVREHLQAGVAGDRPETPTAADPLFDRTRTVVVGNGRTALDAAATAAAEQGYEPLVLAAGVRGEAREAALSHVAIAEECVETGSPAVPPCVLLSGGETTVTLGTADNRDGQDSRDGRDGRDGHRDRDGRDSEPDDGRHGGPNGEFVTSAGIALDRDGVVVASVDTDGIDGTSGAAGGVVDADALDVNAARDALARHDVAPLLDAADALLRTGPTGTNVNDLRVVVMTGPAE